MAKVGRWRSQPNAFGVGPTTTARAFRERRLATEPKLRAFEYGRRDGYRYLRTGNDAANRPIRGINELLEFRLDYPRILAGPFGSSPLIGRADRTRVLRGGVDPRAVPQNLTSRNAPPGVADWTPAGTGSRFAQPNQIAV